MTHKTTLPLTGFTWPLQIGRASLALSGSGVDAHIEYEFRAGAPAQGDQPAEPHSFTIRAVRPVRAIALHDGPDTLSLIISPNTDIFPYLGERQVAWIEENLPVPA